MFPSSMDQKSACTEIVKWILSRKMATTLSPEIVFLSVGSFNPPTPTHFRIFEIAKNHFEQINKSRVVAGIVSPTVFNPQKQSKLISRKHRYRMVNLVLKSSNWIRLSEQGYKSGLQLPIISCLEYHQNFINSVRHGLQSIQQDNIFGWYPRDINFQGSVQVKLLGGVDLLESLKASTACKPSELENVLIYHGIVIVSKNIAFCEKIVFESDLLSKYKHCITLITNWASNEISSSLVRRLIGRKQSVKYLLDDPVIEYISKNNLYMTCNTPKKSPIHLPAVEDMDITDLPFIEKKENETDISSEPVEQKRDFVNFLKTALESKRIKLVRKEQCFV